MSQQLFCYEVETITRAYPDPVLLNDERVLNNLLAAEDKYTPCSDYFGNHFQQELRPFMRKMVAQWMFEVSVGMLHSVSGYMSIFVKLFNLVVFVTLLFFFMLIY